MAGLQQKKDADGNNDGSTGRGCKEDTGGGDDNGTKPTEGSGPRTPIMNRSSHKVVGDGTTQHQRTNSAALTPNRNLRRKVSIEEALIGNAVHVQRLVEYFLVISSHPRWNVDKDATETVLENPTETGKKDGTRTPVPQRASVPIPPSRSPASPPVSARTPEQKNRPLVVDGSSPIASSSAFNTDNKNNFSLDRSSSSSSSSSESASSPPLTPSLSSSPLPSRVIGASVRNPMKWRQRKHKSESENYNTNAAAASSNDISTSQGSSSPPLPFASFGPRQEQCQQEQSFMSSHATSGKADNVVQQSGPRFDGGNIATGASENIHIPVYSTSNGGGTEGDRHKFGPKITARFPLEDHVDNPLNPMTTQFCFPRGELILPSKEYRMPSVHHFVLTNDRGRKVYGTCLTFYEEFSTTKSATMTPTTPPVTTYYVPKCLCILSIWPYVTAFREYLAQLYRLATTTDCMTAPIERYVLNICMEVPAPPPGAFEVRMTILDSVLRFWGPPANLPTAYVALPYQTLFDCLDIDNILHLWYCLTLERQIVLVSSQDSILTVCSEILCSLLFPIKWSHIYVPMLPSLLSPMLDAPVPYLVGVPRDNWSEAQKHLSAEAIVVDLDRNSVLLGKQTAELPAVPRKKWTKLQSKLQGVVGHLFWRTRGLETEYQQFTNSKWGQPNFHLICPKGDAVWEKKLQTYDHAFNLQYTPDSNHLLVDGAIQQEQSQWDQVQEAFLRFFVALFKSYRHFLHIPDSTQLGSPPPESTDRIQWNDNHSFDKDLFIASEKFECRAYLTELCATQQFDEFITKRLYSPELPEIVFFDQSIDAKLNRSRLKLKKVETPFLQSAQTHKQLQTFDAVEPNTKQLAGEGTKTYIYKNWPSTFDVNLFCSPRPIPSMITAEFDRQASLVNKLRRTRSETNAASPSNRDLFGYDYDTSPEGMAFTVFFFAYSAVIGQEWQEYQANKVQPLATAENLVSHETDQIACETHVVASSEAKETTEVETDQNTCTGPSMLSDFTLGLCGEGNMKDAIDNACSYVAGANPCPNFDNQAQTAYETLNNLAMSFDSPSQVSRQRSLLDQDETSAEYQEVKEVAVAQLDLAFDVMKMMESRGLLADTDVFKSLMEACGRCGDTKRALEVIEVMKREGIVAHGEILASFMSSFARCDEGAAAEDVLTESYPRAGRRGSDAYSHFLKKKMQKMKNGSTPVAANGGILSDDDDESKGSSDFGSESGSERSSMPGNQAIEGGVNTSSLVQLFSSSFSLQGSGVEAATAKKNRKRRSKRRSSTLKGSNNQNIPDRIRKQLVLGESLLEFLYPDIRIDTFGDACPYCSNVMKEDDIVNGWKPGQFQDFTTSCPQCQHRFVPRFQVTTSSPTFEGSQGVRTPLFCEFLSPWVLRKELDHIIRGGGQNNMCGIELMLDPDWRSGRDIQATIWWNLLLMFRRHGLPYSFLLQGSFQNRLISPIP